MTRSWCLHRVRRIGFADRTLDAYYLSASCAATTRPPFTFVNRTEYSANLCSSSSSNVGQEQVPMTFYLPIVLMTLATTVYHVAQKSVPSQVSPMLSLTVNYVTALVVTLLLLPLYPQRTTVSWSFRNVNWASYAVGVSIVGVELAVLLAYRVGWKISLASVVGSVTTALLLVAVGLLFFNEHLSPKNVAGIAFCLVGLALIAPR